jgi:hypothetical protein
MMYVAARHTAIDCWEKRRRKGYLFMIGDELAYPAVKKAEIGQLIGAAPQSDIRLDKMIAEVKERYHPFFIIPGGASNGGDREVLNFWRKHLGGDRVLRLDSPEETSECIARTIAMSEGVRTRVKMSV